MEIQNCNITFSIFAYQQQRHNNQSGKRNCIYRYLPALKSKMTYLLMLIKYTMLWCGEVSHFFTCHVMSNWSTSLLC